MSHYSQDIYWSTHYQNNLCNSHKWITMRCKREWCKIMNSNVAFALSLNDIRLYPRLRFEWNLRYNNHSFKVFKDFMEIWLIERSGHLIGCSSTKLYKRESSSSPFSTFFWINRKFSIDIVLICVFILCDIKLRTSFQVVGSVCRVLL